MTLNDWLNSLKYEATPDFAQCQSYLSATITLLNELQATEQDSQWHAEGNVAIHTDMVLSALYRLLANQASHIKDNQRQAIILAALLHDIAKPLCTKSRLINEQVRIVSPHHEQVGRDNLIYPLMELSLEYETVELILQLVGYHHIPKLLVIKNESFGQYLKLALNADCELLYWLEYADMQGRICADKTEQLMLLDEFKMFCQEYQLWGNSHQEIFQNICQPLEKKPITYQQRYLEHYAVDELISEKILLAQEAQGRTHQHAQSYSEVYILCGPSGSGKSSWIKEHIDQGWLNISLDAIRKTYNGHRQSQKNRGQVMQIAKDSFKQALAKKQNVVWDATNLRRDFRSQIINTAKRYHALTTLVVFHLKKETILKRNASRAHHKQVANSVIEKQLSQFQWPDKTEAHRFITITEP